MRPSTDRHWHLVAYDVSDDKRRAKVAKCLEGYGERIQFSVFRIYLGLRALARLRWELTRRMAPTDGLLIIHLCPSCQGRIQDQRGKRDWTEEVPLGFRVAGSGIKHPASSGVQLGCDPRGAGVNGPKDRARSMNGDIPKPPKGKAPRGRRPPKPAGGVP